MKIVIIGGGAIGGFFGLYLARGGHEVIVVERRQEVVDAINARGIGLMAADSHHHDEIAYVKARAVRDAAEIDACDLVILAVKSFDTLEAIDRARHLVGPDAPLISLQTGLGNIEKIAGVVSPEHIVGGFTFMAATGLDPGVIRAGNLGATYVGELDGEVSARVKRIRDIFVASGLDTVAVGQIQGRLWCKVIVYSAIHAVSAILRCRNGELLDRMESISLMKRLVDEGVQVAQARGVRLTCPNVYDLLFEACRRGRESISPMLQDLVNGQRTEIDAQCGAIVGYGEQAGVATPTNRVMVELIRLMEGRAER